MAAGSSVLVRLQLLGLAAFKRDADIAGRSMRKMGTEGDTSGGRFTKVGRAAGGALRGLMTFGEYGAGALVAGLAESTKMAVNFQAAMEMIHTQAGASQREVNKLTPAVLALAKVSPQGPQQLAEGLFHLESIGLRGAKAMNALKIASQGAAVGGASLESTATALGSAWLVNIKGASSMSHVMGLLNATVGAGNMRMEDLVDSLGTGILPAAKVAGLGIKDVFGALAVFTDEGYNASSASAQLGTALHFLYDPSAKAAKALASIGLPANKLAADMHKPNGLLTALTDLRSHLNRLPGGSKGVDAEQTLGAILPGGRGRVLLTLMNQLTRYQMKLRQIGAGTKAFAGDVAATQQTAAYKIHTAWSSIQADMIQIGLKVLPRLAPIAAKAMGAVSNFATGLLSGGKTVQSTERLRARNGEFYTQRVTKAASMPQQIGAFLHTGIEKLIPLIKPVVSFITGTAIPAIVNGAKMLLNALKPAEPFLRNVLIPLLKGVAIGVIGGVVAAFRIAVPVIRVVATVLGFLGNILKPLGGVFKLLGEAVGIIFGGAILKVLELIPKVGIVFRLLRAPIDVANVAIKAITGGVVLAFKWFDSIYIAVMRFIGTFDGIGRKIATPFLNAIGSVLNLIETIVPKFLSFGGKIGSAIVNGIVNLIKAAPGAIAGAISSIVPGPVKSILKKAGGLIGSVFSALASGGVVRTPLQVIGERGPELAALPIGSRVHTAADTRRMLAARREPTQLMPTTIQITINPQTVKIGEREIHRVNYEVDRRIVLAR